MSKLAIVFISDNNYATFTAVAIKSLYVNRNENNSYEIFIISHEISTDNKNKLEKLSKKNFVVRTIDIQDTKEYSSIKKHREHVSMSALFKFDIPNILESHDKVLYVDSDVLILKDLQDLFDMDFEDNYAIVIKDVLSIRNKRHLERLDFECDFYFNSGVMLLNLKKLRQDKIRDKLIDYRKNRVNHFMDQDAFNVVFCNKVKFSSLSYNLLNFYFEVLPIETLEKFYNEELNPNIIKNYKNATILHFGGSEKPWNMWMGYLSSVYLKYSFLFSFKLFFNILIRLIKNLDIRELISKNNIFKKGDDEKIDVSIIIPVYNVEMYLKQCLDSIVNQTLRNIEIICVNDGSTDNSLNILKEYAKKDIRIKIISKPNTGYGHSMNIGLDKSKGKYIGIVEPDDYVELDMYETLFNKAVSLDLDLIKADFCRFTGTGENIEKTYIKVAKNEENYEKVINPQINTGAFKFIMNTWTGIYKRSFLNKYKIRHNETPGASFQDNGFWFQTFALSTRTYFLNKPFYMNRRDNLSSSVHDKGKVFAMCKEYDFIRNFLDNNPKLKKKLIYFYQYKRYHNYIFTLRRIGPEFYKIFLIKFHEDFVTAAKNNELDKELFSKRDWKHLKLIIKDPEKVYELNYKSSVGDDLLFDNYKSSVVNNLSLEKRKFDKLLSFIYILKMENLNPKKIYKIFKARKQIESLHLFDEEFYLYNCIDVKYSSMNPVDHYIYHGWKERRTPSRKFDGNYYLKRYPDVKKSKTNPLIHYVLYGKDEGRFPDHHAEINSPANKIQNIENSLYQFNDKIEIIQDKLNEINKNFEDKLKDNKQHHIEEIENLNKSFENKFNQKSREIHNLSTELKKYTKVFTISHINKEKISCKIELFKGLGVTREKRNPQIIVSLTSYPIRIYDIHYCLYSLLNQNFKPDKLILWLSKEEFPNLEKNLPSNVLNLKNHGLEIRWTEKNFRSYDKLIHSLKEYPNDIIVTADDDVFYPDDWLESLYENYDGKNVIAHRAHLMTFESGSLKPYRLWEQEIENDKITILNFPTGAGGILYPPNVFYKDVLNDELFLKLSPNADDIWFWVMVVLNDRKVKVLKNGYKLLNYVNPERELSLNEDGTLYKDNIQTGNDECLSALLEQYPEIKNKLLEEISPKVSVIPNSLFRK